MVDYEGSTLEATLAQIQRVGFRVQASTCSPSQGTLIADNSVPLGGAAQPSAQLKLSPRQYHVFARAPDRDNPAATGQKSSDQLWAYIAGIHRKRDAIAVSVGLVESGLAVEVQVAVIAQSPARKPASC
jgi:hypothetical protein